MTVSTGQCPTSPSEREMLCAIGRSVLDAYELRVLGDFAGSGLAGDPTRPVRTVGAPGEPGAGLHPVHVAGTFDTDADALVWAARNEDRIREGLGIAVDDPDHPWQTRATDNIMNLPESKG